MDSRRKSSFNFGVPVVVSGLVAGAVLCISPPVHAEPGDTSYALAQMLQGTLLGPNDLDGVAAVAGSEAQSDGTAPDGPEEHDLDVTLLDGIELSATPLGVPLAAEAGVVEQYAYAGANSDSIAAVGTVSDDGSISTGPDAAPPQPLTLSLGTLVDGLGLPAELVTEVADVGLSVDGASARAEQTAPDPVLREYSIDDVNLTIDSAALSALSTDLNAAVAGLQTQVNGLQTTLNANLATVGGALNALGAVTVNPPISITAPNLAAIVDTTLGDSVTTGAATIDLTDGTITIDLDELLEFNGRPANTPLLDSTSIAVIDDAVVDVVDTLNTKLESTVSAIQTQVDNIGVVGGVRLAGAPVISINTTVGRLLDASPANDGVVILGNPLVSTLLGGVTGVVSGLLTGVTGPAGLGGALSDLTSVADGLLTPVTTALLPDLDELIEALLQLTVNVQEGVDTPLPPGADTLGSAERALRVTVLPDGEALTLDFANAIVGANSLSAPTGLALAPVSGPAAGGTTVTITGTNLDTVVPATGVAIDGVVVPATYLPDLDGAGPAEDSLTVTTPPHVPGNVAVMVTNEVGGAPVPGGFTYEAGAVASITPDSGPTTGGTIVTVNGACFTGADSVTFGGTPGASLTVLNDSQIRVASPPHPAGAVAAAVVGTDLCGTLAAPDFTYLEAGLLIGIDPAHGIKAGGTVVQLTGADTPTADNLGSVDEVFVDGITYTLDADATFSAGEFQVIDIGGGQERIDLTMAPHAPGPVSVGVASPLGVSNSVTYTYDGIGIIDPPGGPEDGGNTVTINGECFAGASGVQFGSAPTAVVVPAGEFISFTNTRIVLLAPAHAPGLVDVTVLGTDVCGDLDEPDIYDYEPSPPGELDITPVRGPVAGGQAVTITGTHLDTVGDPTGGVLLGGIPLAPVSAGTPALEAGEYAVIGTGDDAEIDLITPPHAAGDVLVYVTNDGGTSAPLDYEYVADDLTANPDRGPETGGNPANQPDDTITLTGECFTGATGVTFGGVAATGFTLVSDTEITVVPPAHAPGAVDVVVLGTTDCGDITGDDAYTYEPVRADGLALSPNQGPAAGGQAVTIVGNELDTVPATGGVELGGMTLAPITTGDPGVLEPGEYEVVDVAGVSEIHLVTPPHVPGAVDVIVTNDGGPSDPPLLYTYLDGTIGDVDPPNGPEEGGQPGDPDGPITLTGSCFTGATGVLFGGAQATMFTVVSDTTITVVPPPHAPGPVVVTVVGTTYCDDIVSGPDVYTYLSSPASITSMTPTVGPETGGTPVTIVGSGFTSPDVTGVTFGGVPGTGLDIVDDQTIEIVAPPHAPGNVGVIVLSPAGNGGPRPFTYQAVPPTVTGITPDRGPEGGGTVVTVTGTGFTSPDVSGVAFDGVTGTGLVVVSDTELRIITPAHAPGDADVVVTSPAGSAAPVNYLYTDVVDGPGEGEPPLDASRFVPVTPCRLVDTREGVGKPAADSIRTLDVPGQCNVPDDAISATMTLTVTESDSRGYVTAWPSGARPTVSNLNYGPGENRANSTVVRLADDGSLQLYTFASTHLVVDVTGYWTRSSGGTTSGRFVADEPERLLDTRLAGQSPFGPFEMRTLGLPTGVPSDATALAVNITMDQSLGANWFAAFPANLTERPIVSAVNTDDAGQVRAGSLIVPASPEGIKLVSKLGGHLVVDYLGYFTGESAPMSTIGLFVPQAPDRVLDTRTTGAIARQQSIDVGTGVPGSGVIVNLTIAEPSAPGWLRAWAAGDAMPATSSVNALDEPAVANLAIIGQSGEGEISIFTKEGSHAIVDVAGWFYG